MDLTRMPAPMQRGIITKVKHSREPRLYIVKLEDPELGGQICSYAGRDLLLNIHGRSGGGKLLGALISYALDSDAFISSFITERDLAADAEGVL